jgi:deoxyribodipyrimidine photolyase
MQQPSGVMQDVPGGDIGNLASPSYPRPFNPTPPYPHGFPIEVAPVRIERWAEGNTGIPYLWSLKQQIRGPM